MRKLALAIFFAMTLPALADPSVYIRAMVRDADGEIVEQLRYTPKTFNTLAECEEFKKSSVDFIRSTEALAAKAIEIVGPGATVEAVCVDPDA